MNDPSKHNTKETCQTDTADSAQRQQIEQLKTQLRAILGVSGECRRYGSMPDRIFQMN
jgi:hypothetical protein